MTVFGSPRNCSTHSQNLHAEGHAYSVEAWQDGQLAGGVFGIVIGDFYSGESMFHHRPDASKAALVELVQNLTEQGVNWLDIQQPSEHMTKMGAIEISREDFLARLEKLQKTEGLTVAWPR